MSHPLHKVSSFEHVSGYSLRVTFDDGVTNLIDFAPVLRGKLFGPLRDPALFSRVTLDPEIHTLVWPNGADFDPATLYNWSEESVYLVEMAKTWV
jgi:hypothetical protein